MRNLFLCLCAGLLSALLSPLMGIAQNTDNSFLTAVSGGYAYASGHLSASAASTQLLGPAILPSRGNFNGWDASLGVRVSRFIGIAGDFSGLYGSQQYAALVCFFGRFCDSGVSHAKGSVYTFLGGPRLALTVGKFTPFVEAFVGGTLARDSYTFPVISSSTGCNPCQMEVSLAEAFGGGVAYHFTRKLDWYLKADLLQTHFPVTPPPHFSLTSATENSLQASTGVSFRFCASRSCRPAKK
jgi:hypothetical protein